MDILNVSKLEQLVPFLNKDNIFEIATRGKNKKFKAFQKVALNNISEGEGKEMMQQAVTLLNKNTNLAEKSLAIANNMAKLQKLSLVLSGLNLCATCAGFAVMYAKLNKMCDQLNQLINVVKQGQEIQVDYEFKKVISEHSNMLDCRKTQKHYTEEQMRKLVDDEYNVLNMLLDVFLKDLTTDQDSLIFSLYSLASMLAVSLRYFDELYYFNNKEAIGNGDVWHSSHDNWMSAFERLADDEVLKKIQDHGIFDLGLSTFENDVYYTALYDQIMSIKEDIEDNQTLIKTLDDAEVLSSFAKYIDDEVAGKIKKALENTAGCMENDEVQKAYQESMRQMALAV